MNRNIRLMLTANAGLRVTCGGLTLLLDSIYEGGVPPFSDLPDEQWAALLRAEPPFSRLDYLLVTHDHPDHFSAQRLLELLERRTVRGVILPEQVIERYPVLYRKLTYHAVPTVVLTGEPADMTLQLSREVTLRPWLTGHVDQEYRQVQHFCYELATEECRILFTADMDYTQPNPELTRRSFDAVCVNPLLFHELLRKKPDMALDTKRLLVYHIPPEDGNTRIRTMTLRDAAKCPEAILLDDPMEEISL